jgi:hypothetical protein
MTQTKREYITSPMVRCDRCNARVKYCGDIVGTTEVIWLVCSNKECEYSKAKQSYSLDALPEWVIMVDED